MNILSPLAGVRIIEFESLGPAPLAGRILAGLGAEVTLVARPTPDPFSVRLAPEARAIWHYGKRRLVLDLKSDADREKARALVAEADALIEGFRPGVMERLGLGPAAFAVTNPRLVYGRMTGWGQTGPYAPRAGHDLNYVAVSGLLAFAGDCGSLPPVPPTLLGDAPGALGLAFGIVCGLLRARQTGEGCIVDAAIIDVLAMLAGILQGLVAGGALGAWAGGEGPSLFHDTPFYTLYTCADGKKLSVAALEPAFYRRLLERLGLTDIDPQRQYVAEDWPMLRQRLAATFARRTRDEWCESLASEDACVAPVLTLDEAAAHPQQRSRGNFPLMEGGVAHGGMAPRFAPLSAALAPTLAR